MTRVNKLVTHNPTLKIGLGGNYYVFCANKDSLIKTCIDIGKSINSIYYHNKHHCWVFRARSKHHKTRLSELLKM